MCNILEINATHKQTTQPKPMLKFFRKIRQTLLSENKFSKYFLYAIGEIVLVVIGILIALQINNWNEDRKERITEQKILKELLIDFEISKADLLNDLKHNKKYLKIAEQIKEHLHYKRQYTDSIDEMLMQASSITQFTPRTSGYENLKSVGLSIITNDSLRKEITNVFERNFEYARLEGRVYNKSQNSSEDLGPFYKKHFSVDFDKQRVIQYTDSSFVLKTNDIKIRNYQDLLNEVDLVTILQKTIFDRAGKISIYNLTVKKIDEVSDMIKKELEQFKHD